MTQVEKDIAEVLAAKLDWESLCGKTIAITGANGMLASYVAETLLTLGRTTGNPIRVIALVPVESVFPKNQAPVVHLLVGVAFFLPVFAYIWYHSLSEVKDGRKN